MEKNHYGGEDYRSKIGQGEASTDGRAGNCVRRYLIRIS